MKELKERYPDNWELIAEEKCGVGRRRAYELIAIADGPTSIEEQRASNARSKRNSREKTREDSAGHPAQNSDEQRSDTPAAAGAEGSGAYPHSRPRTYWFYHEDEALPASMRGHHHQGPALPHGRR
jgi:hypothetical protein